ncbi:MAG: hypothetical protein CSA86_02540 [Arcobacter sp.]|nr:MAG: hypothetical protein CSA86_02540 [Arcobacter sp.]
MKSEVIRIYIYRLVVGVFLISGVFIFTFCGGGGNGDSILTPDDADKVSKNTTINGTWCILEYV